MLSPERRGRVTNSSADSRPRHCSFPGISGRSCEKIAAEPLSLARETAKKPSAKGTTHLVAILNLSANKRASGHASSGADCRSCEGIAVEPLRMAKETAKKPFAMRNARSVTDVRLSCPVIIEFQFPRGFATRFLPLRTFPPCLRSERPPFSKGPSGYSCGVACRRAREIQEAIGIGTSGLFVRTIKIGSASAG